LQDSCPLIAHDEVMACICCKIARMATRQEHP